MVHDPNPSPPIVVSLEMLDTDYAKLVAGEPIAPDRCDRIGWSEGTCRRLGKQIARYRYGNRDPQDRDDVLCTIATMAELFTCADLEAINDRLRWEGCFYLTEGERQQVVNWLQDELAIDLTE